MNRLSFAATTLIASAALASMNWSQAAVPVFAPLDQWKTAVLAGDAAGLTALYSTSPAMQVTVDKEQSDADAETKFWISLKARAITLELIQRQSPQAGVEVVAFQAEVQSGGSKGQTLYITEAMGWKQQADQWQLFAVKRTGPTHLKQPVQTNKNIYPSDVDAHAEIKEAEEKAAKEHKRVLLVFGANWCYDCHVLDLAFQRPDFVPVVARYEVVHVDIGDDGKKNADVAKQFEVPLAKGVPALAVVESTGKLLVSQKNGEFENARAMTPEALLEFLNKWKTEAP
jgi:thioredoxin 1